MEQVLWLYAQPYDERYPVVCFDERPCFLIGEAVSPIPMKEGKVARQHYEYQKNGSCSLLAAIEPLTGRRLGQVHDRRTKKEFAIFMKSLASSYPNAIKIRVVLDNLNTHITSSFYENLPAEEAFALSQRFEFYYTPLKGSWLNMIEIEFSALSKICLDRRIATKEILEKELSAIITDREVKGIKITWQFSIKAARTKLARHYLAVNGKNGEVKEVKET
jgi:transposase